MAIGPTLQDARLKKQLTTSQVAEMTRMKVQIVDDLEHDDFHRIAATIYGKGFIKLFAECVDLDPKPLIADYMRTVKGGAAADKPPATKSKSPPAAETPLEAPASPPPEDEAPASDLFEFASSRRRRITPASAPRPAADATETATAETSEPSPATQAGSAGDASSRHHTRSVSRPLGARIRGFLQPLRDRSEMLFGTLKGRLANVKWNDRLSKAIGLVLGGLIILLILITVIRQVADRVGPRPPEDHELLLFVPPPEPYIE